MTTESDFWRCDQFVVRRPLFPIEDNEELTPVLCRIHHVFSIRTKIRSVYRFIIRTFHAVKDHVAFLSLCCYKCQTFPIRTENRRQRNRLECGSRYPVSHNDELASFLRLICNVLAIIAEHRRPYAVEIRTRLAVHDDHVVVGYHPPVGNVLSIRTENRSYKTIELQAGLTINEYIVFLSLHRHVCHTL